MISASFVLWDGLLFGGAETATIALCSALRQRDVDARVTFVGSPGVYENALERAGVPWTAARLERGSAAMRHPSRFTRAVLEAGRDVAVVPGAGFLAVALRLGGYRGPIVAVEHGGLLQSAGRTAPHRVREAWNRRVGTRFVDAQVAVSDYLLRTLETMPHSPHLVRIHNGVDIATFARAVDDRAARRSCDSTVVIGCAGKLMRGKGFEDIIASAALLRRDLPWLIRVAGDGDLRGELGSMCLDSGVDERVDFVGWQDDMVRFWSGCDIAVAASNGCVESFGMVVAEAMASGIPCVVSRSGGLPEVLGTVGAGLVFEPGDVAGLTRALETLISDESLRIRMGESAFARAGEFGIDRAAAEYASLLGSLVRAGASAR